MAQLCQLTSLRRLSQLTFGNELLRSTHFNRFNAVLRLWGEPALGVLCCIPAHRMRQHSVSQTHMVPQKQRIHTELNSRNWEFETTFLLRSLDTYKLPFLLCVFIINTVPFFVLGVWLDIVRENRSLKKIICLLISINVSSTWSEQY